MFAVSSPFRYRRSIQLLTASLACMVLMAGCPQGDPNDTGDPNDPNETGNLNGWVQFAGTGNYYKLTTYTEQPNALAEATAAGGYLAIVDNATENAWLVATFAGETNTERGLWLGLTYIDEAWVWPDDTSPAYTNWAENQPVTGDDRCAVLQVPEGAWTTLAPTAGKRVGIIERDASNPPN